MLAHRCRTILIALVAATVFALAVLLVFTHGRAVEPARFAWPHGGIVVALAGFVAAATLGGGRRRPLWRLAAGACLVAMWSSFRVLTMGDGVWWREATAAGTASQAEPLSSLVYGTVHALCGGAAIEWVPPAIGFVATYVWLADTDRLFAAADRRGAAFVRLLAASTWASTGVLVLFFHRYVEHTQLGIPFVLLGLARLSSWSRDVARANEASPVPSRDLLAGSACMAVAAATHLEYSGLAVAAIGAAAIGGTRLGARFAARTLALAAAAALVVLVLVAGLLAAAPFEVVRGSIYGGDDVRHLTPAGELLGAPHAAMVATAVLFAAPAALPFALVVPWLRRDRGEPPPDLVLAATALAWLVFVATYGFDLGWPRDVDLMISMSPPLLLLVATDVLPAAAGWPPWRRRLAVVCLGAAVAWAWAIAAPLVRPNWTNLSQRNSPAATLLVAGARADDGDVPYRAAVAAGETVELSLRGPPGHTFWILAGVPHPACEGNPYGSVVDIELREGLAAAFVHHGVLDDDGRATVSWVVRPLADGRWPGLQALTFPGDQHRRSTASAAFYFVPD